MAGRPRSFVCPDDLWAACERMAWQSGRPVDDVVTESLRRFMQGSQTAAPPPFQPTLIAGQAPGHHAPPPPPVRTPSAAPPPVAYAPPPVAYAPPPVAYAPPPVAYAPPPAHHAPPPPAHHAPPPPAYGAPPAPPQGYGAPPPMPPPMPPHLHPSTVTPPAPAPGRPYGAQPGPPPFPAPPAHPAPSGGPMSDGPPSYPIYLYCEGERAQIMQPRFIIGRSRNASDFAINDSNVSRQHAAVEWLRGHYHIVDMGSTNGILFQDRRVERKVIYDGDVIVLAGHSLRFARQ